MRANREPLARNLVASLAAALVSAGCAALAGAGDVGRVTIGVRPQVVEPGFRTQAVVAPHTESAIEHVAIKLFKISGGAETAVAGVDQDLPRDDLTGVITISGLAYDTPYRIRAHAYRAPGAAAADLISSDASSSVDVAVGRDDRPGIAILPIVLAGQVFGGQASNSVTFTDGVLTDAATPSAEFGSPRLGATPAPAAAGG